MVKSGIDKNIYNLPDFSYEDFLSEDVDIQSKPVTADIRNTFNNFTNTDKYFYVNGWVNSNEIINNSKIYIVLMSDKDTLALKTNTMRRKELKIENKQNVTDDSSYSIALLNKQMNIPSGIL